MSCVSASDIDPTLSNNQTPINEHSPNEQITVPGNYEDLNHDIQNLQPGDTYNIDMDYYFDNDGKHVIIYPNVIIIGNDNITINGNGHVIDAGGAFYAIFKVTGNNVKILNLTIINSKPSGINIPSNSPMDDPKYRKTYHDVLSPISWYGDNGVISDCKFINNEAINGGAVSWKGNNGIISNCIFINNTARGIGGAIYMGGANNTISSSAFINSFGKLSNEALYLDRNRKDLNISECAFETGGKFIVDGAATNIDVNYLNYDIASYMSDEKFNLVHIIYSSIMNGGLNYMDNGISYYAQYDNKTCDFTLSIIRYFNEYGITYRKDYTFKNITDLNEIFTLIYDGNFVNDLTFMLNKTVNNLADYNAARLAEPLQILISIENLLEPDIEGYLPLKGVKFVLNVNFASEITIRCEKPWNLMVSGFDAVIINGNGSRIWIPFDESNEYHWASLVPGYALIVSDLTIWGFNTAIENLGGNCTFNNVVFKQNRMNYWIKRDWGGAILNTGIVICSNCTFIENYAKNGGAIFNQGLLILENCTFSRNGAYGKGSDVCMGKGGVAKVNGLNITGDWGPIYFANGLSLSDVSFITIWCVGTTVLLSVLAGAASGGLFTAAALGFAIGSILSMFSAKIVCDNVFDIGFDTTLYASLIIGGSIVAGMTSGIIGYVFLSGVTCCDLWCIRHMGGGPDYMFLDDATASSLSSEISSVISDSSSVISAIIH